MNQAAQGGPNGREPAAVLAAAAGAGPNIPNLGGGPDQPDFGPEFNIEAGLQGPMPTKSSPGCHIHPRSIDWCNSLCKITYLQRIEQGGHQLNN